MIQFIDLKSQYHRIKNEIDKSILKVLDHGQYIMGPEIEQLESTLSKYVGVKYCISMSSGTDALLVPLMALDLKPGDEVIVPNFSFFATAEVVELLGGKCIFVDVDPRSYNINPDLIEEKISKKTKAIIAVSLYGRCADFDAINEIADKYGVVVIEDAAQSFGATYKGRKSGSLCTIGATSFFPSKPLGCYGDGGACFTNDDDLATKMKAIRVHGQTKRYYHSVIGINARMDTLQAAILLEKMKIFDDELKTRRDLALRYYTYLKGVIVPESINDWHAYAQYSIESSDRDGLIKHLGEYGIPTAVHYPGILSEQPALAQKYETVNTPISMSASRRVLSLPMSPYLSIDDQDFIIEKVNEFISKKS